MVIQHPLHHHHHHPLMMIIVCLLLVETDIEIEAEVGLGDITLLHLLLLLHHLEDEEVLDQDLALVVDIIIIDVIGHDLHLHLVIILQEVMTHLPLVPVQGLDPVLVTHLLLVLHYLSLILFNLNTSRCPTVH